MFSTFDLFGREISVYVLLAVVGIFAAGFFACYHAKKRGHDDNDMIVTLLITAIGVLLGGHILYGVTNAQNMYLLFSISSFSEFIDTAVLIFGGSVFYGGLIGGTIAGYIYMKKKGLDFVEYSDIIAPAVPLFHFFGRIGCFMGGCCYGIESDWGITFHNSLIEQANNVNRFPVQLCEAAFNLVLFLALWQLLRHGKMKGHLFTLYMICYPIARFFFEFLRGDEYRGFLLGLSTSQIISILLVLASVGYEIKRKISKPDKQ